MGVMNHNVVVATTWKVEEVERLEKWINNITDDWERELFIVGDAKINNYRTIVLVPDGSKEGWSESAAGDALRAAFICEIKKADYGDGSNPWDFVEVGFGEYGQKVLHGNNKNCYDDTEYAGQDFELKS